MITKGEEFIDNIDILTERKIRIMEGKSKGSKESSKKDRYFEDHEINLRKMGYMIQQKNFFMGFGL